MQADLADLVHDYQRGWLTRRGFLAKAAALGVSLTAAQALLGRVGSAEAATPATPAEVLEERLAGGDWEVVDLSVSSAQDFPCSWPTADAVFTVIPETWFKRLPGPNGENGLVKQGVAAVQRYEVSEHVGTQIDFPPHFIPPPGLNIPGARGNRFGLKTGDRYPLRAFMGRAVVVDVRALLDANQENGKSAHLTAAWLRRWEDRHGRLRPGDVPMWYSGYSDRHYRRFPDDDRTKDRMLWQPLVDKSAPGWVAPDPDAVELLHERGVVHAATDGPSWGWTEGGQPSHVAGLRHGMTWTEFTTGLGKLPRRGAFYVMAPYKVRDQQAGIGRAFAFKQAGVAGLEASPPERL
jgi:isatin hydrolase